MNLFNKIGKKKEETNNALVAPEPPMDPIYVLEASTKATMDLRHAIELYNRMVGQAKLFKRAQYEDLMQHFKNLAREFEKLYALMEFDHQKIISLEKYSAETDVKRQKLVEELNAETEKPPADPKKEDDKKDNSQKGKSEQKRPPFTKK